MNRILSLGRFVFDTVFLSMPLYESGTGSANRDGIWMMIKGSTSASEIC